MIKVSLASLQINRCGEALDGLIELTHPIQADSLVVVGECVLRFDLNRFRVILNCLFELTELIKCKSTIEQSFKVVGIDF